MAKFTNKQAFYLLDKNFERTYKELLTHRLTDSNLELENISIYDAIKIYNNSLALNMLFNHYKKSKNKKISEDLIIKLANTINKDSKYISDGYRNIGEYLEGNEEIPISKATEIKSDMKKLIYDYYNTWSDKDVFEREALFNIEFLRIHPFEDGNGRTSRLLLSYNLITQGYVPSIILPNVREEYFKARNSGDVEWIKNKFEELSNIESNIIDEIIDNYMQIEKTKVKRK